MPILVIVSVVPLIVTLNSYLSLEKFSLGSTTMSGSGGCWTAVSISLFGKITILMFTMHAKL